MNRDQETAVRCLAHILIIANLPHYSAQPEDYRRHVIQLLVDYKELEPVLRPVLADFNMAIALFSLRCLRDGKLTEPHLPGRYRPDIALPQNVAIMAPLYAARLAYMLGDRRILSAAPAAA